MLADVFIGQIVCWSCKFSPHTKWPGWVSFNSSGFQEWCSRRWIINQHFVSNKLVIPTLKSIANTRLGWRNKTSNNNLFRVSDHIDNLCKSRIVGYLDGCNIGKPLTVLKTWYHTLFSLCRSATFKSETFERNGCMNCGNRRLFISTLNIFPTTVAQNQPPEPLLKGWTQWIKLLSCSVQEMGNTLDWNIYMENRNYVSQKKEEIDT